MTRVVMAVCTAVFALVACGNDAPEPITVSTPSTHPPSAAASSVIEKLAGNELCGLLTNDSIKRALGVKTVEGGTAVRRGRLPVFLSDECRYDTNGFPSLSTRVVTTRPRDSDQDVLDDVFTDRTQEDERVVPYRRVPGVGSLAGFGRDPVLSQALKSWDLGVVAVVAGERLLITLSVTGDAELDQLRPLAELLLKNLGPAVS